MQAEVGYVMWNDEFPGSDPPEWPGGAHAKGVLGFGTTSGFYLLHSVPKFPAAPCMDCPDGIGNGSYTGIALVRFTAWVSWKQTVCVRVLCAFLSCSFLMVIKHVGLLLVVSE